MEKDVDMLNRILLPKLKNRKVGELTRRDIEPLIIGLKATPYTANRVRGLLSKMFSLAMEWEWMEKNPVRYIPKFQEHKRMRWLDAKELERLMNALDRAEYQLSANVVRLLIYTGARKGEVLKAEWQQFDLGNSDSNGGVWVKPSHNTKQKQETHTPLSEHAVALLRDMHKAHLQDTVIADSPYLFPSPVNAQKPIAYIDHFWKSVCIDAGLTNARVHDLRHSFASHLVQSGVSLPIIGRLLGHTQAQTTMRYAHLADKPLREATNLFMRGK